MNNEITITQGGLPQAAPTPADLLRLAVEQGGSVEAMSALMDMQLKWEANEARKAYHSAMAAFKAHPPTVRKDREVKYGNTQYKHATLANVTATISAAMSDHGLTASWRTDQAGGQVTVTCTVTHELGHSESTSLSAPADNSGSKNAIQAIGSAVTYLQRYTLLAMTGLAATDQDDDGVAAGQRWADPDSVARILKSVEDLQIDQDAFFGWLGCDATAMTERDVQKAEAAIAAKRRRMEKEMER